MCLKSCILISGNPAFTLAVFQLVNIFMYGFFVFGDANRYLDCLVVFLLVCWLGRLVKECLVSLQQANNYKIYYNFARDISRVTYNFAKANGNRNKTDIDDAKLLSSAIVLAKADEIIVPTKYLSKKNTNLSLNH